MPRVKGGFAARKKHNRTLELAKGYRGSRSKLFRRANEAVIRAGEHAFAGRRIRRRDMRKLWIARLTGALSEHNINYSRFIKGLKDSKIELDRKLLSEMAIHDKNAFDRVVEAVKKGIS